MSTRRARVIVAALLIVPGAWLVGARAWMDAKAMLAARLIERAFRAHIDDGQRHRPWSWADHYPVAQLDVPRLGVRRFVLAGASGGSLAFGPGHVDGTDPIGARGHAVIAGHRDRWFAFLGELVAGDVIRVQTSERAREYVVVSTLVVDERRVDLLAPTADDRLTLVTCHPIGGLTQTRQRYVVTCVPREQLATVSKGAPSPA